MADSAIAFPLSGNYGGATLPIKVVDNGDGTYSLSTAASGSGTDAVNLTKVGGATFALGQALAAASLPVVLTAAQLATLGTTKITPVDTATPGSVASSASNVTLLSANASRRAASITNDSTAVLYVKFGATASTSSYKVQIPAGGYYEFPIPIYTGIVDGIWASANGSARIDEEV